MTLASVLRDIHNGNTEYLPLVEDDKEAGSYTVPEWVVGPIRRLEAYWLRKDKKKFRRWQHQKRKQ